MKNTGFYLVCIACGFFFLTANGQATLAFQGAESGDTWSFTTSGAGTEAPAEALSAPNIVSGAASLVAGGNTGGGSCFGGGSGNGPSTARYFTFDEIDISGSSSFTRTLTFHWGNRFPACNGTGWDAGENLTFEAFHDGVSQGIVTLATGANNASFSIQSNAFSWDIPPCISHFSFTVSVTTNRRDELLFLDDVQLTTPGINAPLSQPSAIAGNDTLCVGAQETYSVAQQSGIIYTWDNLPAGAAFTSPNGTENSDSVSIDWGTASAGTYTISVTPSNTCGNSGPAQQLSITLVNPATPVISGPATICSGSSVTLTSGISSGNTWSTGETTPSITVSSPGTYTVSVQTACGTVSATHTITASPSPQALITPAGPTTFCAGQSVTLISSGSVNNAWSTGSTDTAITVSAPGTYILWVSNSCGAAADTIDVSVANVSALFTASPENGNAPLQVQFNNAGTPAASSYSWDFGNGETAFQSDPSTVYESPGSYTATLTVINSTGCSDSYSLVVEVGENLSSVEIPNVFSPNGDQVNDLFEIHTQGLDDYYLAIFNRWGNLLKETNDPSDSWDGKDAAGNDATAGTYIYKLRATGADGRRYEKSGFVTLVR